MHRNLIITASILIFVGGSALGWVVNEKKMVREDTAQYQSDYSAGRDDFVKQYNQWLQTAPQKRTELPLLLDANGQTKSREQLRREELGRLRADLDKLASGEITAPSFADVLYGENWHEELTEYKKRQDFHGIVFTSAIVCGSAGAAVCAWFVLLWIARLIVKAGSKTGSGLKRLVRRKGSDDTLLEEPDVGTKEDFLRVEKAKEEADDEQSQPESRPRISVKPVIPTSVEREHRPMGSLTQRQKYPMEREKIRVLMSDDKSSKSETAKGGDASKSKESSEEVIPFDNTLTDLTEQVSAIREYAANQQNRLEKLQDGYDWNIIRTFCLRVIRCVDNLETRIAKLTKNGATKRHLEEVRDELIFALESSGIEP